MSNEENAWQALVEAIRAERAAKTEEERQRLAAESQRLAALAEKARDERRGKK
jgi:hypothetical protein